MYEVFNANVFSSCHGFCFNIDPIFPTPNHENHKFLCGNISMGPMTVIVDKQVIVRLNRMFRIYCAG